MTKLSRHCSVEPKNKKQFSLTESGPPLFFYKKIEFAGVLLKMIYCLPANKATAYGPIGATRGEVETKRSWKCVSIRRAMLSIIHNNILRVTLKSLLLFSPLGMNLRTSKCMHSFDLLYRNAFLSFFSLKWFCFRIQYHGHHSNWSNHGYRYHYDSHIITWLFQERYHFFVIVYQYFEHWPLTWNSSYFTRLLPSPDNFNLVNDIF